MRSRSRLARTFRGSIADALISIALVIAAFVALATWPDYVVADFAIPVAIAIGLGMWRR